MFVSTTAYQFAHGKHPRGEGCWAFFFDGNEDVTQAKFFFGTFAAARKQAVEYAKAHGHKSVAVGS